MSGASTPGGSTFVSLSEGDLRKADAALMSEVESDIATESEVESPVREVAKETR